MYILLVNIFSKKMKTVSLKLDESIFGETENILSKMKISRNRYINDAINHYNILKKRQLIEEKFKNDSRLVQSESMKVLKEFEDIEYGD